MPAKRSSRPIPREPVPLEALRRGVARELSILTRSRRSIVANVSIITLLGFIVSLTMGEKYVATASIMLPPAPREGTLAHFVRRLPVALTDEGAITPMHEVAVVSESRRISAPTIRAHDLVSVYGEKSVYRAHSRFTDRLEVALDPRTGVIRYAYWDKDPERAAAVLTSTIEAIDDFYRSSRRSRGRTLVEIVESRIDSTNARLLRAELALGEHQRDTRSVFPSDDAVDQLAALASRAMMLDVELTAIERFAASDLSFVEERRAELDAIRAELRKQPGLALGELRLRRELVLQRELATLLGGQLTAARALAAQEVPYIEAIDMPVVPSVRSWPGHIQVMASTVLIALASAVLLAHVVAFVDENRRGLHALTDPRARAGG